MMTRIRTGAMLALTAFGVACGGGGEGGATNTPAVPPAPTILSVTPGNGQVTVTWVPVSGATSYNLYWSTSPGVTTANGAKVTGATSPYVQASLANGVPYYCIVTAVSAGGESAPSALANATPNGGVAPAVPTGVIATPGNGQVTVTWPPVSGATSYNLYWSTSPGVTVANGTKVTGATSPHVQGSLANGVPCYVVVTAVNAAGESAPSAQVSATPNGSVAPTVPTGVSATPGNGQVTVAWSPAPGATSYNLYWSTSPGVTRATGTKVTGASSPYVHLGLVNGTAYHYVVTSVNQYGESTTSAEVSATPNLNTPPAAPTGVTARPGSAQVVVSWSTSAGATSYNVYWSTSPGVTKANGTKIPGATSPYTHAGLADGTAYYYVVTAVNAAGESAGSAQASGTTAPPPPAGLTATALAVRITLTWTAAPGATSYNVYWSTTPGVTKSNGTKISGATSPYGHASLAAGTTYYYVVTAANTAGESSESAQASAITAPPAPTGVTATATGTQVSVAWGSAAGATSYNIYWSTTSGVTPATGNKMAGATSPTVQSGLTNATTYYYVVTAANAAGESAASTQVSATTVPAAPTGVTASPATARVAVSWIGAFAATSYNLYWSTTPGVTPATGTKVPGVTSPYAHTGLAAGTTYYYVLTAANSAGESAASSQVSATTAPPAPTGVAASVTGTQVSLSWASAPGATSYTFYWSTSPGVTPATGIKISGVNSPAQHAGLARATTYYYVVTASNAAGESPASSQVSATTLAFPPMRVTATPGNAQVTVSWPASAGASWYDLYWSTTPGVTTATGTRITNATSPYLQTGLANGATYYYVVTAVNAAGVSETSSEASATLVAPPPPTGPRARAGDGRVLLAWDLSSGATSYNIYWSTSPGVTTSNGTRIIGATQPKPLSSSPFLHSGLANGTTYYYVVTAVNPVGESAASPEASATPTAGFLSSGDTRLGASISTGSGINLWTFQGVQGDRIIVNAVTTSGKLDTIILLYPPGGGPAETSTELGWTGGDQLIWQLQATGTYTMAIRDWALTNPGTYDLTFFVLPSGDPNGAGLTSGQTLTGRTITGPTDMESFEFIGTAGDTIILNAVTTSGTLDTIIFLYPPGGGPAETSTELGWTGGDHLFWQLQATGTYTVLIRDWTLTKPGTYDLTYFVLPSVDPNGGDIYPGQTLTGRTITGPSDMEAFQFTGTAGDNVILTAVTTAGTLDTIIFLYPPGGGPAETSTELGWTGGDQLSWQLKATGKYTVLIQDWTLTKPGIYDLSFTKFP